MNDVSRNLVHLMNHVEQVSEEGVRDLITSILQSHPGVGWELGPHPTEGERTVLSLSCKADQRALSELASKIGLPVHTQRWSIVAGTPPRAWDRYFEIVDEQGSSQPVDANEWAWRLHKLTDKAEIELVFPASLSHVQRQASDVALVGLIGELGEANVSEFITLRGVTFSGSPTSGDIEEFGDLKQRFVDWFPLCHYADFLRSK
jgi:hypothetical protein